MGQGKERFIEVETWEDYDEIPPIVRFSERRKKGKHRRAKKDIKNR